jgi:sulfite exporter TauE/SafE
MTEHLPIASGFLLGLSTGPVCMVTCLPVVLPFSVSAEAGTSVSQRWLFLARFMLGRLVAYALTGLVTGLIASRLGSAGTKVGIYAWIALSFLLIAYGLGARIKHIGLCGLAARGFASRFFPYLLGFLTGLSVCPPFLLALSYVLERSVSVMFAVVFFLSFFCATSIYVLPIGFLGHLPRRDWLQMVGRFAAVVVGIFFLWQALFSLVSVST